MDFTKDTSLEQISFPPLDTHILHVVLIRIGSTVASLRRYQVSHIYHLFVYSSWSSISFFSLVFRPQDPSRWSRKPDLDVAARRTTQPPLHHFNVCLARWLSLKLCSYMMCRICQRMCSKLSRAASVDCRWKVCYPRSWPVYSATLCLVGRQAC